MKIFFGFQDETLVLIPHCECPEEEANDALWEVAAAVMDQAGRCHVLPVNRYASPEECPIMSVTVEMAGGEVCLTGAREQEGKYEDDQAALQALVDMTVLMLETKAA